MSRIVGRYLVLDPLASGGMASVHLGQLRGGSGFRRFVAVKMLHAALGRDPEARAMFIDEARIVSRIRHPNVIQTLDVLEDEGDLFLVMDYADGVPLSRLMKDVFGARGTIPVDIVVAVVCDLLEGLHAAHEARDDNGSALSIVHRDVSPQNIMIARDGSAKVLDFGIARASDRAHLTSPGEIKGKAAYMAPEQARGSGVDRRADIYASAIVLWELLSGRRLFQGESFAESILKQLEQKPEAPSTIRSEVSHALDAVVLRGLAKSRDDRFPTAEEMMNALVAASPRAARAVVSDYVADIERDFFRERDALLANAANAKDEEAPSKLTPSEETRREGPPPKRGRVWPFVAALGLVAFAATAFVLSRNHATASDAAFGRTPSITVPASVASIIASAASPATSAHAPESTTASIPSAAKSVTPVAKGRLAADKGAASEQRSMGFPSATARTHLAPDAPLPPCCAGTIQIRFSDCTDNCPR